jgi:hypothetical protein
LHKQRVGGDFAVDVDGKLLAHRFDFVEPRGEISAVGFFGKSFQLI